VDVRVIAATNRNLAEMVKEGSFRSDLFYRLNVFPIKLPSLRERQPDIPLLAEYFLNKFSRKMGKNLRGIAPRFMERLIQYSWPGNVRELQNVIERAIILAQGSVLEADGALDFKLEEAVAEERGPVQPASGTLEATERAYILKVLEDTEWIIEGSKGAAAVLGMKPSTLRSRMQKLNIRKSK
jgi:formate hydrogenlyase transcriptional activator